MVDVLFRGRIKKSKKWVYGYYCKSPITDGNSESSPSDGWYFLSGIERQLIIQDGLAFEVELETIDQYTGMDDKNGVKIFRGDIVVGMDEDEEGLIVWDIEELEYRIDVLYAHLKMGDYYSKEIEVIGNIHDNLNTL